MISSNVTQINSEHKAWKLVGMERKTDAVLLIKKNTQAHLFIYLFLLLRYLRLEGHIKKKQFQCQYTVIS